MATAEEIRQAFKAAAGDYGFATERTLLRLVGGGSGGGVTAGGAFGSSQREFNRAQATISQGMLSSGKGMDSFASKIIGTHSSIDQFDGSIASIAAKFGLTGGAIGLLAHNIDQSLGTYRDMIKYGQDFGGNLLNMSVVANQAGLSLRDYSDVVIKNSEIIARVGNKDFGDLQMSVRRNIAEFGAFGLKSKEVAQYTAEYLDTQRAFGDIENLNVKRASASFSDLITQTTALSKLSGKDRDRAIQESLKMAVSSDEATLAISTMGEGAKESWGKINAQMVHLPDAIKQNVKALFDTGVATGNMAHAEEAYQALRRAGHEHLLSGIDDMIKKTRAGQAVEADGILVLLSEQQAMMTNVQKNTLALNSTVDATWKGAASFSASLLAFRKYIKGETYAVAESQAKQYDPVTAASLKLNEAGTQAASALGLMSAQALKFSVGLIAKTGVFDGLNKNIDSFTTQDRRQLLESIGGETGKQVADLFDALGKVADGADFSEVKSTLGGMVGKLEKITGVTYNSVDELKKALSENAEGLMTAVGGVAAGGLMAGGLKLILGGGQGDSRQIEQQIQQMSGGGGARQGGVGTGGSGNYNVDLGNSVVNFSGGSTGGGIPDWLKIAMGATAVAGVTTLVTSFMDELKKRDADASQQTNPQSQNTLPEGMTTRMDEMIFLLKEIREFTGSDLNISRDELKRLEELVRIQEQIRANT